MKPTILSPTEIYKKKKLAILADIDYELITLFEAMQNNKEDQISKSKNSLMGMHEELVKVEERIGIIENKSRMRKSQRTWA
ncbi:hypothetical protein ABC382_00775 [Lysinibacillus sp. 1P01SD]|uniref:hypothetical protein n=1 Tax=Lysinibacillus sp. 1P01SD TaxID=3132285 RepID=UPI0039A14BEC